MRTVDVVANLRRVLMLRRLDSSLKNLHAHECSKFDKLAKLEIQINSNVNIIIIIIIFHHLVSFHILDCFFLYFAIFSDLNMPNKSHKNVLNDISA